MLHITRSARVSLYGDTSKYFKSLIGNTLRHSKNTALKNYGGATFLCKKWITV